eukprot:3660980-Amphidinium_carterae.1
MGDPRAFHVVRPPRLRVEHVWCRSSQALLFKPEMLNHFELLRTQTYSYMNFAKCLKTLQCLHSGFGTKIKSSPSLAHTHTSYNTSTNIKERVVNKSRTRRKWCSSQIIRCQRLSLRRCQHTSGREVGQGSSLRSLRLCTQITRLEEAEHCLYPPTAASG